MKEKAIKEGLERLLKEQDSQKVGEVFDRMTGQNRSVPDRLWSLRERIKGLTEEAEDLSSLLEYHSGSRLSQVIDHLKQAETLTEETMSLTTNQAPSQEFKVEETESTITITDETEGIGIRFKKGDRLAQYRLNVVVDDRNILTTDEGMRRLDETRKRILSFAREEYPQEFGHLVKGSII